MKSKKVKFLLASTLFIFPSEITLLIHLTLFIYF